MRCQSLHSCFPLALAASLAVLALPGCSTLPGRPGPDPEVMRPGQVLDFNTLYKQNCSGCHGAEGKRGAAVSLADPLYLALVDDATLRRVTANGVPRTAMPAFARSAGGTLTDQQIERLGLTLMRQAQEIERLRKEFGLEEEDLNLDLGPLGKLL